MDNININIPGSKLVSVEGELSLVIGSRDFYQEDIGELSKIDGITGILFYFAMFHNVDLSVLKVGRIKKLSFLHGNFGDKELKQLGSLHELKMLKILDTNVSLQSIEEYKKKYPDTIVK